MTEELNWEEEQAGAGDEFPGEETPALSEDGKRRAWLRLVALITVIGFAAMVAGPVWHAFQARLPSAELIQGSQQWKEQIDRELLAAVVRIQVISGEWDPAGGSGQKSGTGFNVRRDGLIITNHHVIEGARSITVTFPDGRRYRAKSWNGDPDYDLAVIPLVADGLPAVTLNPEALPAPGDALLVIGNPMGLNQLVVAGALEGYVWVREMPAAWLCIDAPVFPGNSGSPVFDAQGQVVAVVCGSLRREEKGEEKYYGLAVPVREVLGLLEENPRP